jgi:hypothetical protein
MVKLDRKIKEEFYWQCIFFVYEGNKARSSHSGTLFYNTFKMLLYIRFAG